MGLAGEEQLGRETICEATTHLLRGAMGLDKSGQEGSLSEADKPSSWPSFLLPVFSPSAVSFPAAPAWPHRQRTRPAFTGYLDQGLECNIQSWPF